MKSITFNRKSTIQPLYSKDYQGEWINVSMGDGVADRRFIRPKITFTNPSGNAICLGNGKSRADYSLKKIENNNSLKILRYYNVIYGCNGIYREWQPDFLLSTHHLLTAQMPKNLHEITYAYQEIFRRYPDINLMPGNNRMDAGSSAAYLAAFHGAKNVFLFGYDGQPDPDEINSIYLNTEHYPKTGDEGFDQKWIKYLYNVIEAYPEVKFYRVTPKVEDNYRKLLTLPNYYPVNFRQFISLADL